METISLTAQQRTITGKKVKRLRQQGVLPLHLYGKGIEPLSLQAEAPLILKVLGQAGSTSPVNIKVDGKEYFSFVSEVQRHPVTGVVLHVDFFHRSLTEKMRLEVPLLLAGQPPAVKLLGGSLMQSLRSLLVECLPTDLPSTINVDVSSLDDFEKAVRVADIPPIEGVVFLTDPETVIAKVQPPRAEEEVVAPAAEVTPAEVEVVKPAKKEEEEEAAEEREEKG